MVKPPRGYKPSKRKTGSGQVRMKHEKVKTARGRKYSSKLWLERQLNDPYVVEAKRKGYRSRAAFKLIELNDKFKFLKSGGRIVDLGAAPGGWCQVASEIVRTGKNAKNAKVIGIDLLEMEPLPDVILLQKDFTEDDAPSLLKQALGGQADVVMSDMAAWTTGHKATDHLRIIGLAEMALEFALEVLAPNGVFVAKVLQGGSEDGLLGALKANFKTVKHAKPAASRSDSAEMYVVATGFRSGKDSQS